MALKKLKVDISGKNGDALNVVNNQSTIVSRSFFLLGTYTVQVFYLVDCHS